MYLDDPFRTRYRYTDFLQLPLAYDPGVKNILFIGLGGGSAQKRIWRDFPQLDLQVVELDPAVRDVAYRYFELPRSPRLKVASRGWPPVPGPRRPRAGTRSSSMRTSRTRFPST